MIDKVLLTPAVEELSHHPLLLHVIHLCQVTALQKALLSGLFQGQGPAEYFLFKMCISCFCFSFWFFKKIYVMFAVKIGNFAAHIMFYINSQL